MSKDLIQILEENFGRVKLKGNYAYIHSPFNPDDKTPSCAVLLRDSERFTEGFFKDFSSGRSGNIYKLLGIPHDYKIKKDRVDSLPLLESPSVVKFHLSRFEHKRSPYLFGRGISYEVQERFKVYGMKDRVSMPVFDKDGYFVYDVSRLTQTKGFANSAPTDAIPAFTHAIETNDTVFVCEAMIDAYTLWTVGLKAISLNSAINYSGLRDVFKHHFGRIVLALDPDDVGQESAAKIQELLFDRDVVNMVLPRDVNACWTGIIEGTPNLDTARVVFLKLIERKINNTQCPCHDCKRETLNTRDYYMVRDEIWLSAVPEENHCGVIFLCRDCLSARLGRALVPEDFADGGETLFEGLQS